jgi:hypothetical protein
VSARPNIVYLHIFVKRSPNPGCRWSTPIRERFHLNREYFAPILKLLSDGERCSVTRGVSPFLLSFPELFCGTLQMSNWLAQMPFRMEVY